MPVHVTEDDDLDAFLESNLTVFKEKAFTRLASKSVRKAFLKLVLEGDLLEVTLDEQQLLASLWYLLYKKNRVQERKKEEPTDAGAAEHGGSGSSEEVTDSELEISSGAESDWNDEDSLAMASELFKDGIAEGAEEEVRRGRASGGGNMPGMKKMVNEMKTTFKIQTVAYFYFYFKYKSNFVF